MKALLLEEEIKMTTFNDIFKSSFLENVTSVSILDMVIALVLAFLMMCAAMNAAVSAGEVIKTVEKRKSYFRAA